MQEILKRLTIQNIFLVDSFGAFVTALLLSQVLARFVPIVGMPKDLLFILATIAGCYMIYSLFCHFSHKKDKRLLLRIIAIANCLYCVLTFGILLYHYTIITVIGWSYFIGEIVIVLILALAEYKLVQSKSNRTK